MLASPTLTDSAPPLAIPAEAWEHLRNALERHTAVFLHRLVFAVAPEDRADDEDVSKALRRLQWLPPSALRVPDGAAKPLVLRTAVHALRQMNSAVVPEDKLACLTAACTVLYRALTQAARRSGGSSAAAGADDFLPAMIYVTLQANLPRLSSNIAFIERFRDESQMMGRAGYCFTNLRSCVFYLRGLEAEALRDPAALELPPHLSGAAFVAKCGAAGAGALRPWLETA